MQSSGSVSALVVGSTSHDIERGSAPTPGGVVHYAGQAFARLGARTRVITCARNEDLPGLLEPLRAEGIEALALDSCHTTICLNDYSGAQDAHHLAAVSDPITPVQIPEAWRAADVVHLGPLHRGDLHPETISALRGLKGIDLQGLVREPAARETRLAPFADLAAFLVGVPIVKVSEQELEVLLDGRDAEAFRRRFDVAELLVTRGARGALLVTSAGVEEVAPAPAVRRHPTGAGDVFLAAYLFARARGSAPIDAARRAARVSAVKIERGAVPKGFRLDEDPSA